MSTIVRVDAPGHLRDLDAQLGSPWVLGRIVLSLIMAAAAPVVLVFALVARDPVGIVAAVVWFAVWTAWMFRLRYRLQATRPYRVTVRAGLDEIREAHRIYHQLSRESSSREYALPLINTMYRISVAPVRGEYGERRLVGLMRERVAALRRLQAAEDDVAIASAGEWINDRDDVAAVNAYMDALREVEAQLHYTL